MPKIPAKISNRLKLLRELGRVYDDLNERHMREQRAIGNRIPAGGGEWMDLFFRSEGIRGVMTALRDGKTLDYSIQAGKKQATAAVLAWNTRRKKDYQVHRWEQCMDNFVERTVRKALNKEQD